MFVLDTKGKDALVVFPGEYIVCIIAHDYAVDKNKKISWDYGDYFLEISEACKKFYSKRINYYDKHSEFINHRWDILAKSKNSHRKDLFDKKKPLQERYNNIINYG